MTKRMRLVALALAVLLAGCSGGEKKAVSPWGEKADRDFFIRLGSSAARTIADDFEEEGVTGVLRVDYESIEGKDGNKYALVVGVSGSWELEDPSWKAEGCRVAAACISFDPACGNQWNCWETEDLTDEYEVFYPLPVAELQGSVAGARAELFLRRDSGETKTLTLESLPVKQAKFPHIPAWLAEGKEPFANPQP